MKIQLVIAGKLDPCIGHVKREWKIKRFIFARFNIVDRIPKIHRQPFNFQRAFCVFRSMSCCCPIHSGCITWSTSHVLRMLVCSRYLWHHLVQLLSLLQQQLFLPSAPTSHEELRPLRNVRHLQMKSILLETTWRSRIFS